MLCSANVLGDFVLDRLEWRQQLTEEVVYYVGDKMLGTGQHEVVQRLTSRPRLPGFVFSMFVLQLLSQVFLSTTRITLIHYSSEVL